MGGATKGLLKLATVRLTDGSNVVKTVDCSNLSDYKELTTSCFMLDYVRFYSHNGSNPYSGSVVKSYNADTGVLTITKAKAYSGNSWHEVEVYVLTREA